MDIISVNAMVLFFFFCYNLIKFNYILALSQCDQLVNSNCQSDLHATKKATCECIDSARDDLKTRIAGIVEVIRAAVDGSNRGAPSIGGSGTKVDACINNIKRQL